MPPRSQYYFMLFCQVFAGMGIGILMGVIIGLSASPVVKSILGTISGLLGVFLGLQDNIFSKSEDSPNSTNQVIFSSLRAGSFGLFCALGILYGLYLRTNDSIGMSVTDQVEKWTDAGYELPLAHELALYEKINLTSGQLLSLHEKAVVQNDGGSESLRTGGLASTVLFSFKDLPNLSRLLDPKLYDNDPAKTLENYKMLGVPQIDVYTLAVEQYFVTSEDQLALLSELTSLTIALSTREKEYKELNSVMRSFLQAKEWTANNELVELQNVLSLVEVNVPDEKSDEFMGIIADVLFEIDFGEDR